MDDIVATFSYDIHALRLEYKTTCDALEHWRGGDPTEQEFLIWKKRSAVPLVVAAVLRER